MSKTEGATVSRSDKWHEVEGRYLGRCMWQVRAAWDTLVEGLEHRQTGRILVVQKVYAERLPPKMSTKPWPELESVQVYAPMDAKGMTWDGLEAALRDYAG